MVMASGHYMCFPSCLRFLLMFRWRKWSLHWRTKLSIVGLSPPLTQTCLHGAHLNIWRKASGLSVLLHEGDKTDFFLKKKKKDIEARKKSIKCGLYTFVHIFVLLKRSSLGSVWPSLHMMSRTNTCTACLLCILVRITVYTNSTVSVYVPNPNVLIAQHQVFCKELGD